MIWGKIASIFTGKAVDAIGSVVDNVSTSDEEKTQLKNELSSIVLDHTSNIITSQKEVIIAETQSESWLTRSWRPITMLTFVAMLVLRWTGITPQVMPIELEAQVFDIIQFGLGGYVVGREITKVADKVTKNIDLTFLRKKDRKDDLR